MCELCNATPEDAAGPREAAFFAPGRRGFLLLGLGLLAGCAHHTAMAPLPAPPWPEVDQEPLPKPRTSAATPVPPPPPVTVGVLPRSAWTREGADLANLNAMAPIRYITVHHDGMEPFWATDREVVAAHLEEIRRMHRRRGWADIGYHFAIDRAGRVWAARPLKYQGAHVKDHNPGNIGIVVLGNFEQQAPSAAQLAALQAHLRQLMRTFRVSAGNVQSHQEWGAPTACPGRGLQVQLEAMRHNLG